MNLNGFTLSRIQLKKNPHHWRVGSFWLACGLYFNFMPFCCIDAFMVDILLIQPPIADFYLTRKRTIPCGLMSIAASLEKKGFDVALLDAMATHKSRIIATPPDMAFLEPYYGRADRSPFGLFHHYRHFGHAFQHIGKKVKEAQPFLVGIASLFTPYADMAVRTAEIVKKYLPGCWVVLGGHHPTELPCRSLASRAVDFIIRGEGEIALPMLAEALKKGKEPRGIPGVCFQNNDGTLKISEPAIHMNLDDLPLPAVSHMQAGYYRRGDRTGYAILASRGCPFKCSYCAMGRSPLGVFRQRSIQRIIAEMDRAVKQYNCGFFDFEDENLSHDRTWFANLLESVIRAFGEKTLELRAMNGLFPPSLDHDLLKLMKKAGFKTLNLSLGSTAQSQLRRFNRPDVRRSFDSLVHAARELDLACVGYIIVGAPFQDPLQSVNDLLYLWQKGVLAGVSVYYPAPGSADFEQCQSLNLLPQQTSLWRSSALPLDHVTSRLQTVTLLRLGRIANFMKALSEKGIPVQAAATCRQASVALSTDRFEMGCMLLKWFFHDRQIRGVDIDGRVYTHTVDRELMDWFVEGLQA